MIEMETIQIANRAWRRGYWNGYVIGACTGVSICLMMAIFLRLG